MNSSDLETIKGFALDNPANLSTFIRICSCFDGVKAHLRNKFIEILMAFLRKELGDLGWEVKNGTKDWRERADPALQIVRQDFPKTYYHVAMESDSRGVNKMAYGILNGEDPRTRPKADEAIWRVLNDRAEKNGAKPNQWWSWSKYLEPPYLDWNHTVALTHMFESMDLYDKRREFAPMVELIGNKLVSAAKALDFWRTNRSD